jgi:hypothetical protein
MRSESTLDSGEIDETALLRIDNMLWIVLFLSLTAVSALRTIFNNARFEPDDQNFELNTIQGVNSPLACACLCFNQTMCLTSSYSGIDQSCTLYFARLN